MKIRSIETFAVYIPRDEKLAPGGAGSPAALEEHGARYTRAATYGTVYGSAVETMLVRIMTEDGVYGWGEAQAPVLPEVAQEIVDGLLAPLLFSMEEVTPLATRHLLYEAMKVRGHSGGFYLDALAAVDCALWDIAGKTAGLPLCRMLGGPVHAALPTYVSGLTGETSENQLDEFERFEAEGLKRVKVFLGGSVEDCLRLVSGIRQRSASIHIYVDALWRLDRTSAFSFANKLAELNVSWLEAPMTPEDIDGHRVLAQRVPIRIAAGESYRSCIELLPLLQVNALAVLQPDIGRTGITEGMRIASLGSTFFAAMAPHISIGLGPQIAAALHVASCWPHLEVVECNPRIYEIANRTLVTSLAFSLNQAEVPRGDGLGVELNDAKVTKFSKVRRAVKSVRSYEGGS